MELEMPVTSCVKGLCQMVLVINESHLQFILFTRKFHVISVTATYFAHLKVGLKPQRRKTTFFVVIRHDCFGRSLHTFLSLGINRMLILHNYTDITNLYV